MFQRSLGLLAVAAALLVLGGCVAKSDYLRKQAEADALSRDVAALTTENQGLRERISGIEERFNSLQSEKEGIDPSILSAAAFGEYQPVAENDTPGGRAKNRRIAIILLPMK